MPSRDGTPEPPLRATPVRRRAVLLSGLALPAALLAARVTPTAGPAQSRRLTLPGGRQRLRTEAGPASSPQLTLPEPTGSYRLGTVTLDLIDTSRPDPWVPAIPFRELIVQLWYPAQEVDGHPREPYFTPITARAYEQEQSLPVLRWPVTEAHLGAPVRQRDGGWPVVLFSPGLGDQREFTTSVVEDLASHGYVVVTIDHVHDSGVVELPDGSVATSAVTFTSDDELQVTIKEVESRSADVSFILDQLAVLNRGGNPDHERRALPRGLRGALDLRRTGMFGHSDGGSTTAHAMHADSRIKAGADMDGTLWTPEAVAGSGGALLLFGEQNLGSREASTWAEFSKNQRGPKLQLSLLASEHATFTDFAVLVPQVAPLIGLPPGTVTGLIGTINGDRAVTVERAYLRAWFDKYLRHHDTRLLNGPSPRFPEVQFAD